MDSIHVHGGICLQGKVKVQGSKNAALPILAATLLTRGTNVIHNCPKIADVYLMLHLLDSLGCRILWDADGVKIDTGHANYCEMPVEAIRGMRSSLCLLGALLGRTGKVSMEYPGGCVIGKRPIDLHLEAFRKLGAQINERDGRIDGNAGKGLKGTLLSMPRSSVGATENAILAAVSAKGHTCIRGAAREPEVAALCDYLCRCGAKIDGIGTGELHIWGGRTLRGVEYRIPADRIVAGTYLLACMGTGGSIFLEDAPISQMDSVIRLAKGLGARCQGSREGLYLQAPERLLGDRKISTQVYPGFPTDLQSVVLAVFTKAPGCCVVEENIFEDRFRILDALALMGARIKRLTANTVAVYGPVRLKGHEVAACELRGGAALVTAGLMADGETVVKGCEYIERGYENICRDFRELGARIYSVSSEKGKRDA